MSFKVLILAKYGRLAASTRQRLTQYIPYLQAEGAEVEVRPLLPDAYLRAIFSGQKEDQAWTRSDTLRAYRDRLALLPRVGDYDVVLIYLESFPYLPAFVERMVTRRASIAVYDFDDAIFQQYDLHRLAPVRWLLGGKIGALLRDCNLALCGNAYLGDYADRFCPRTEIVPTVVDLDAYHVVPDPNPRIGWIGSPSTWNYLSPWVDLLRDVSGGRGAPAPLLVGTGQAAGLRDGLDFADWSEAQEVALIREAGIGIMPLDDGPWAMGKCGYKLIQYMACGLPVVASPVGVNRDLVRHGVNGFLAGTETEWREALTTLMGDADLRRRMGAAGRQMVEEGYSLQIYGPKVAREMAAVVAARRTSSGAGSGSARQG